MHSMRVIGEKLGDYSHLGSGHTGRITCSMHCMRVIGWVTVSSHLYACAGPEVPWAPLPGTEYSVDRRRNRCIMGMHVTAAAGSGCIYVFSCLYNSL